MDADLSQKIAQLPGMKKSQRVLLWRQNFDNDPPPKLRKELMVPILAYRMQERAYGGLSHTARKRLREIALSLSPKKQARHNPDAGPIPETKLIRFWHGETHEVLVTGDGYVYRGHSYASLSKIACLITGTQWSGPRFFGVKK